jgi:hypothetical protein
MQNKILLVFLAFGGLLLFPHSSYAATNANTNVTNLSRNISELANLALTNQELIEAAIQRALIVKEITGDQKSPDRSPKRDDSIIQSQIQTGQERPSTLNTETGATAPAQVVGRRREESPTASSTRQKPKSDYPGRATQNDQIQSRQTHVANTVTTPQKQSSSATTVISTTQQRGQNFTGIFQANDMGNTVTGYRTPNQIPQSNAHRR